MTIQETILSQIGGPPFKFFARAKVYGFEPPMRPQEGIRIIFNRTHKKVKIIDILYLEGPDLYRMEFFNKMGEEVKPAYDEVFCDQLVELINKATGLDLPTVEFGAY